MGASSCLEAAAAGRLRRQGGRSGSTGRGRGGRNKILAASWDLLPLRAHPQGHAREPSLLPGTFLSLSSPPLRLGLHSPGVALLLGVGLETGRTNPQQVIHWTCSGPCFVPAESVSSW